MRHRDEMQAKALIAKLSEYGWRVLQREESLDWWALEFWKVQSEWTPVGFTIYLTLLTDPQPPDGWLLAVGTSRERPYDRKEAGEPMIWSGGTFKERHLLEFCNQLSRLRDAGVAGQ